MKTPPQFFSAARTSRESLSRLIDGMIHQQVFAVLWATRRSAQARAHSGASTWSSLPYGVWAMISTERDATRQLFGHLRHHLTPADYRTALAVARSIANETHRRWKEADEAAAQPALAA